MRSFRIMKRLAMVAASVFLAAALGVAMAVPSAYAAHKKVDCDKVMQELNSGKKPKAVAKDLDISRSSVYRCRRKARRAERKPERKIAKAAKHPAASPVASPAPAKP
jgi:Skp family chaperone for outer membrane proteins